METKIIDTNKIKSLDDNAMWLLLADTCEQLAKHKPNTLIYAIWYGFYWDIENEITRRMYGGANNE